MKYGELNLGQIEAIVNKLGGEAGVQRFLSGASEVVVREQVDTIIRRVRVNHLRNPDAMLNATGRKQYVTDSVVAAMPRGEGDEADVHFFKIGQWTSDDDLEQEYAKRGLKPADSYSLAAVNEADPGFADERPNGTHWKDADGKWCYIGFLRGGDERYVSVHRFDDDWGDHWWFAGLRK